MNNSLVIEIPQALFASAESASFDGKYFPEHLHNGPDEYHFEKPCVYHIDVQKVDDAIIFSGTISGEATTLCGRCLDEVSYHLESDIDAYFLINEPGH
ncbi:MAG: hypothetical protein IJV62_01270 [Eggerthellaceae bacterium]|nr:hypothetical protein [Eggerthellaceae bacterium]